MDSTLSILAAVNLNYLKAQVVLLPLAVVYLAVLGTRAMRLRHRVWLHDGLLAASLALPVAVALASLLPRVQVTDGLVMPALAVAAAAEQGLAAPRMFRWYSLAAAVGLLGVVWFPVQIGRQYALERRLLRGSRLCRTLGKVTLVLSDEVPTPFSTGLVHHRVFLTGTACRGSCCDGCHPAS